MSSSLSAFTQMKACEGAGSVIGLQATPASQDVIPNLPEKSGFQYVPFPCQEKQASYLKSRFAGTSG